jgi:nucleoside-diphosphate-sugar epimerase
VFTLTDGAGVRTRTFFEPYARLAGRPLRAVPTPVAVAVAGAVQAVARAAPGDNDVNPLAVRYLARTGTYSIAKARAVLGYAPRIGLEEGQRRSLDWLREHYRL